MASGWGAAIGGGLAASRFANGLTASGLAAAVVVTAAIITRAAVATLVEQAFQETAVTAMAAMSAVTTAAEQATVATMSAMATMAAEQTTVAAVAAVATAEQTAAVAAAATMTSHRGVVVADQSNADQGDKQSHTKQQSSIHSRISTEQELVQTGTPRSAFAVDNVSHPRRRQLRGNTCFAHS